MKEMIRKCVLALSTFTDNLRCFRLVARTKEANRWPGTEPNCH